MKSFKKALTVVLAVAVMFALSSIAAFAENTQVATPEGGFTVTINNATGDNGTHTYEAYQIFSGTLAKDENNKYVLSDIAWGSGITDAGKTALGDATTYAKSLTDSNAEEAAETLSGYLTNTTSGTYANGKITGLQPGYYLIKDNSSSPTGDDPSAKTKYILQVVADQTVNAKTSVPTVDKEIAEGSGTKVSDYSIGDTIPYTITGTLPSTFEDYSSYKTFTFTDTMSNGLTPPSAEDVTVKVGEDDIKGLFDVVVNGQTITVSLKSNVDLKTAKHGSNDTAFKNGDAIVVSYKAELNNNAVTGGTGNINTAQLTFSNNPNSQSSGATDETGTTPGDKTVVFTYDIKALKVEPTDEAPITETAYNELSDAEKANYVKVGSQYQKVKALTGAGFTLYKGSVSDDNKVAEINEGSTFEFKGVDAGTYILRETTIPDGYNGIPDIEIVVTATYKDGPEGTKVIDELTCTPSDFVATASTGTVEGKILNQAGSELPSTGGMGTKIFTVVGLILIAGAAITLIVRRRMHAE